MPYFKEIRDICLGAYSFDTIDDTEFVLLYDLHKSKNPDIPYWRYEKFDLEKLNDDQCKVTFRFSKNHIYNLKESLNSPEEIMYYNSMRVDGAEVLCAVLKRFAYPCRFIDMIQIFARPIPQLPIICNQMTNLTYENWNKLLSNLNQPWLSTQCLQGFCNTIRQKGAALSNCRGFVDGIVRPISRPNENKKILYKGYKKVHIMKFQSVVSPNGLVANLYGPVEGKRHDSGMLAMSDLLDALKRYSVSPYGHTLSIYGDPAYPLRPCLQAPFRGAISSKLGISP